MSKEKAAEKPTLDPKLEPEEGTIVQTGDEEIPTSEGGQQENNLKAIYKKARENRESITREDEAGNPDAELIAKMVAESADEEEHEHAATEIDLDARPDRFAEQEPEPEDKEYIATPPPTEEIEPEAQPRAEKPAEPTAAPSKQLDYEVDNGKVKVKVEGIEYLVPEADIESAGGIKRYQQNRAANQRFEKAATYGKALQKERHDFEQQQHDSPAKGEPPEQGALSEKAELKDFRERILDAAMDGTANDVDEILNEYRGLEPETTSQNSPGEPAPKASDQVVEEYETAYKLDRAEANRLLMDDYSDIMDDPDLRKIAHSKYMELSSDPKSFGRTSVEMARESGNFVRRIANSSGSRTTAPARELEARREKKRVLPRTSEARTKALPPEQQKPRSGREYIRDLQRKQGSRR